MPAQSGNQAWRGIGRGEDASIDKADTAIVHDRLEEDGVEPHVSSCDNAMRSHAPEGMQVVSMALQQSRAARPSLNAIWQSRRRVDSQRYSQMRGRSC